MPNWKEIINTEESEREETYRRLSLLITEYLKEHRSLTEIPENITEAYETSFHTFFKTNA